MHAIPTCDDCGSDLYDIGEYAYMTVPELWPPSVRFLCIGCLESRIGRQLTREDFNQKLEINLPYDGGPIMFSRSERLRSRQGL